MFSPYVVIRARSFSRHAISMASLCVCYDIYGTDRLLLLQLMAAVVAAAAAVVAAAVAAAAAAVVVAAGCCRCPAAS